MRAGHGDLGRWVIWADVGTLGGYLDRIRQVSDAAFHEGEDAG